ncbi:hypothetical protein J3R83DRAFT_3084 [Lanmaoa asiatica]|nr:hypothetical protein J3R83DRAFT_3084 [Lanmaoa asiatica]
MTTSSAGSQLGGDVFQNSIYIGMIIQNILYGIELYLYFTTMHVLLANGGARNKHNLFYAIFSSMMLFLVTVWVVTQAIFNQKMWLSQSNFPGGPNAYWAENNFAWYMDWGAIAIFTLQLMTEALMIHRCRIIWNSYRVIVIPIILWLAILGEHHLILLPCGFSFHVHLALGIMTSWTICSPRSNWVSSVTTNIALTYTTSIILHTTLTCMICYRMVRHARTIRESLGHEYASLYFAIVTIIVESVLPYTLSGVVCLVLLATRSAMAIAFISAYFMVMCISPQVLILRVILGGAHDSDTIRRPDSTIKFSPRSTFGSQQFDDSGTRTHVQTLSNVYLPDRHSNPPSTAVVEVGSLAGLPEASFSSPDRNAIHGV